jgi:predicted aldo/keto reductase-like oxidoreductase
MAQGYFDYFGFSCHDEYAAFKGIIDSYDNWSQRFGKRHHAK